MMANEVSATLPGTASQKRAGAVLRASLACAVWVLARIGTAGAADAAEEGGRDREQLEVRLDDARERLDAAAEEVAELTRELHGEREQDVVRYIGRPPRGAMLGVNVDTGSSLTDGVRIVGVSPGGPAAAAGLRSGDVITAIDGKPLATAETRGAAAELVARLRDTKPGSSVRVDFRRGDSRQTATVATAKAEPPVVRLLREREVLPAFEAAAPMFEPLGMAPFDTFLGVGHGFGSLELVSVTPKLGRYFGTDEGLLVVRAPSSSDYRLEEGDVLLAVDGREPSSPGHAFRILRSYQPGEKIKLSVLRDRKRVEIVAQVPEGEPEAMPLPSPGLRVPVPPRPPVPAPPPSPDAA